MADKQRPVPRHTDRMGKANKETEITAASNRSRRATAAATTIPTASAAASTSSASNSASSQGPEAAQAAPAAQATPAAQASQDRPNGRATKAPRTPVTYDRPVQYSRRFKALLNSNNTIKQVQEARRWKPQTGDAPFPHEYKLLYLYRLREAILNHRDAIQFVGPFYKGELSDEDIDYACHMIWDACCLLHDEGVVLHQLADPTTTSKSGYVTIDWAQRNLPPLRRLEIIIAVLTLHKKLCQDVLKASSTIALIQILVAAPSLAWSTRVGNADLYAKRHDGENVATTVRVKDLLHIYLTNNPLDTSEDDDLMEVLLDYFPDFDQDANIASAFAYREPSVEESGAGEQVSKGGGEDRDNDVEMAITPDSGYVEFPTKSTFSNDALPEQNDLYPVCPDFNNNVFPWQHGVHQPGPIFDNNAMPDQNGMHPNFGDATVIPQHGRQYVSNAGNQIQLGYGFVGSSNNMQGTAPFASSANPSFAGSLPTFNEDHLLNYGFHPQGPGF